MANTAVLDLPLVAGNQAQKHVTVNEALLRIDALAQLVLQSTDTQTPPNAPAEGEVWAVPDGANGDWAGQAGQVAVFLNGGWAFVPARAGWLAFVSDRGARVHFDGVGWIEGAGSVSPSGAGFVHRTVDVDHPIGAGGVTTVPNALPANTIVYGVTGRVLTAIGGASSLRIGVAGSDNRYGSGIGVGAGAWARGLTGTPLAYYSDTNLILTAEGGDFDGSGEIRLAVHFAELTLPRV